MNIIDEMFLNSQDMIMSEPVLSSKQMVIALEFHFQLDGKLLSSYIDVISLYNE